MTRYTLRLPPGPGDSLLVYTDGAMEIHDQSGRELGREGFQDIVKAHIRPSGLLDITAIEEELLVYSNSIRMEDDMSLIWLSRAKPAAAHREP